MRRAALPLLLVAASLLVYVFLHEIDEPRRVMLALATLGFFWAPLSDQPLALGPWLAAVALVGWGAQMAGTGRGGLWLWLACSVLGALLLVRGGGRAAAFYLPESGSELGARQRSALRRELQTSVALFLLAYVFGSRAPMVGALATAASAALFLRYVLLQSKFLGVPARPPSGEGDLVPSQRFVVLALFAFVGGTPYPDAWLSGQGEGPLLVTAALLSVLAALLVVLAVARTGWPRSVVRKTSFLAGMLLAVALTAILVELESWDRSRYRIFASICVVFLVLLPFAKQQTRLFDRAPRLGLLLPPTSVAVMMAPLTAMNGTGATFATTVFLFATALLMLAYFLVVAARNQSSGRLFLAASIGVSVYLFATGGGGRSWQVFFVSVGFVLYAVDLFERVWRETAGRERIET